MRLPLFAAAMLLLVLPLRGQWPVRTANPAPDCFDSPSRDTMVISAELVDSRPTHREIGRLIFPVERVPRDSTHIVRLRFVVNADGRPDSTRIQVTQSPDSILTASARRSLLDSRYWPSCRGGLAVRSGPIEQVFRFRRQ